MNNTYIKHDGIKGMKWGIRRFQNKDGTLTEEGKRRYANRPESSTWRSKDAGTLSDAELNRRNSRLQREEQYRRMTQSKMSKAAKWIAGTAGTILVASAIGALKGQVQKNYKDYLLKGAEIIKKHKEEKLELFTVLKKG